MLNTFIVITEQHMAHVVLASSDYSLVDWLSGSRFRTCFLVFNSFTALDYGKSFTALNYGNFWFNILQRA